MQSKEKKIEIQHLAARSLGLPFMYFLSAQEAEGNWYNWNGYKSTN